MSQQMAALGSAPQQSASGVALGGRVRRTGAYLRADERPGGGGWAA